MTVRTIVLISAVTLLAGCAKDVAPTSKLMAPSARLMAPPAAAPEIAAGSDLVVEHLKLRQQYNRETARLRSLQGYVKTLRGAEAKPSNLLASTNAAMGASYE